MTNTAPKPFVFVLMPFSKDFDDIYQLGIKSACSNVGAYAERVDEQLFQESILDRVYNQISKADIIIADMTGRNPNVFYETGYAHALGKPVVLMTKNGDDIPFDLKHYPHIIYKGRIADLIPEVEKRVLHLLTQPRDNLQVETKVEFFMDGISLSDEPTIKYRTKGRVPFLKFTIDAHNPVVKTIQNQRFQIGLETSSLLDNSKTDIIGLQEKSNVVKLPDGKLLHLPGIRVKLELLPGAWESINFELESNKHSFDIGQKERLVLRMFHEQGVYDQPFYLAIVENQQ